MIKKIGLAVIFPLKETFNSLLADIGGSLGLWLGLNIYQVVFWLGRLLRMLGKMANRKISDGEDRVRNC